MATFRHSSSSPVWAVAHCFFFLISDSGSSTCRLITSSRSDRNFLLSLLESGSRGAYGVEITVIMVAVSFFGNLSHSSQLALKERVPNDKSMYSFTVA